MPPKPNINHIQNTNKNKPDKNTNTIQPARLIKSTISNKNNSGDSIQHNNMNSPANDNWTTQTSKKNLSSSSSGSTSHQPSKNTEPKSKKLFSTRNRYEPLTQTEPTDMAFDTSTVLEDLTSLTTSNHLPRFL